MNTSIFIKKEWKVFDYKLDTIYHIIEYENKPAADKKLLFIRKLDKLLTDELKPTTKKLFYKKWNIIIHNKELFTIENTNYEVIEVNVSKKGLSAGITCFYLQGQGIVFAIFDHGLNYKLIKLHYDETKIDFTKLLQKINKSKIFFPPPPPQPAQVFPR